MKKGYAMFHNLTLLHISMPSVIFYFLLNISVTHRPRITKLPKLAFVHFNFPLFCNLSVYLWASCKVAFI